MNNGIEEQLSKSRTTYRDLHHLPRQSNISPIHNKLEHKMLPSEDSDDDTTLPTFVNQFFFPKNIVKTFSSPPPPNDSGMFRAIRGQVIIHHDNDRASKVQCEENRNGEHCDEEEDDDEELENLSISRVNGGNYELHYDVDNPLEISCSMSLSSAETISDHSSSPMHQLLSNNDKENNSDLQREHTPVEISDGNNDHDDDDDGGVDDTPSPLLSDIEHHEHKISDHDSIKDQDEKLRTFRGWHLSMLRQIDEKLREIELETVTNTNKIMPNQENKKSCVKILANKKKVFRPSIRRRFETTNDKRHHSPISHVKINKTGSSTPPVEEESRTLIINLPPSSSSSSSDNEQDFPPPPTTSEPINIRIVQSPIYPTRQRAQSTEPLSVRDQGAQTEPFHESTNNNFNHRPIRPASVESDRIQPTRSLTRLQGNEFLQLQQQQQHVQRPTEQIRYYSLRSRNIQPKPSLVTQAPSSMFHVPRIASSSVYKQSMPIERNLQPVPPPPAPQSQAQSSPSNFRPITSPDPSVYSDDYGHVTQMNTKNLGNLVDKVFDDIYQDRPTDFYRDYRQLLNDIQIRFSMVSSAEQPPIIHHPGHVAPPPPPPPPPPHSIHRSLPSQPMFVDYPRISQNPSSSQARRCDTLIYIPNTL
ncbi:unnamed protein product [Rotaria magnacalcarata]|uniref:Uncharacterized protein n=1 Tax=Rotaria magnacalcarata TaxID=392030 RepID=A0A817A6Y5_9BILA|nr:unnamed protein product [Rotaria magnacalcarata]CAF3892896.1 unnamed protein product [Rotaria magnacalcarata]